MQGRHQGYSCGASVIGHVPLRVSILSQSWNQWGSCITQSLARPRNLHEFWSEPFWSHANHFCVQTNFTCVSSSLGTCTVSALIFSTWSKSLATTVWVSLILLEASFLDSLCTLWNSNLLISHDLPELTRQPFVKQFDVGNESYQCFSILVQLESVLHYLLRHCLYWRVLKNSSEDFSLSGSKKNAFMFL